jgi:hypothetical protein
MMINLDDIDLGYVVSLAVLREVLASLNRGGKRWWIASDPADALANGYLITGHGDPGCVDRLNTLYYRLPVLSQDEPAAGTDRFVILLEPSIVSAKQPGLYSENGRVVEDELDDIRCFLFPILRALTARFEKL